MPNVLVEEISLENIASAIRNKNGLTSTYTPSQMASAIRALLKSGFSIDDVSMEVDFKVGRTLEEELPYIPGYDYSKLLSPDFSPDEYLKLANETNDINDW